VLLITATGIETDTWYLVTVGGIGMLHNLLVAGLRRNPSALGIHLNFREVIGKMQTMDTLLALEAKYPQVGFCLLPIFFPGELLPQEKETWDSLKLRNLQLQRQQHQQQQQLQQHHRNHNTTVSNPK
jgi:hypothetical protein